MSAPDPRLVELVHSVVSELAPTLAEEVHRQALEEATARVRERLVAEYSAALQEALLRQLADRAPIPADPTPAAPEPPNPVREETPEQEPACSADPTSEPLGWYLYAFVSEPNAALAGEPGLDPGYPIEIVGGADLAAVGSPVRLAVLKAGQQGADLSPDGWFAAAVRRHEQVVEGAGATVVPMRFGTVYPERAAVQRLLERYRDVVLDEVGRLADRAEWGVKLVGFRRGGSTTTSKDAAQTSDVPSSGAGYLRRKAESRSTATAAREAERTLVAVVHERLAGVADADVSTPVQRSPGSAEVPLLNASYLVPSDRLPDFEWAVAELAEHCRADGVELQLTGPWPPYHFVTLRLADESRAS